MAQPAASPFFSILGKAIWSPSLQNRLPDASFMLIEPGGVLDETGRTSPRSLRHLPIVDLDGALDLPHLRSAIDQIPKAGPWLTPVAKRALLAKACGMLEKAQATTHKAGAAVPNWALGYLAHADMHEALGLDPPLVAKAWRGDTMVAKRASSWVKSYKGAKTRAPKLAAAAETALRKKVAAHNAAHGEPGKRVTLSLAKAVYQRGTAACAASGRPMVKSAGQWGMARTNAFLRLVATGAPHLPEYVADNDLRPARPAPAAETPPAAEAAAEPLETQKDDGELAPEDMPRRTFQGIPLVIDRPRGFVQTGTAKDGTPWEREYKTDYGYIPATLGGDDEELDVFVGPNDAAPLAYWVAQTREDGRLDEYKVFLGYDSEEAARACYLEHIPARFMGSVFATPVGALQALLGMHPAEMQREVEGTPEAVIEAARAAATGEDVETMLERLRVALAAMDATQKAGADKYDGIDFAPPDGVREALRRGLALHEEGFSGDGLQSETVSWATRMAAGENVSPDKARKMAAWFARHAVDEKADWATEKTPGYVAWMLWGGDPGRAWAEKLGTQMDARDNGTASKADADPGGEVAEKAADPAPAPDAPVAKALDFCAIGKDASGAPREERYVLGPALIPDVVDLQGDTYTREAVRETAFKWMREYQNFSVQHSEDPEAPMGFLEAGLANHQLDLVENYIVKDAGEAYGDRTMPAGTWMVAAIVVDDALWADVKAGRKTGWSIGGLARRTPIAPAAT